MKEHDELSDASSHPTGKSPYDERQKIETSSKHFNRQNLPSLLLQEQHQGYGQSHERTRTNGLSREEETLYTSQIQAFRDALAVYQEHWPVNKHNQTAASTTVSTLVQWARAMDLSPLQLRKIIRSGQIARATVLAANVGLVTWHAKHFSDSAGASTTALFQDLLQEGYLGLIEAAERFDPTKNCRFSTYAVFWIRQRMIAAKQSRLIRLPGHVLSALQKSKRIRREWMDQWGQEPSVSELSNELGVSEEKLQTYVEANRNVLSLEREVGERSGSQNSRLTLQDTLASPGPTVLDMLHNEYMREAIRTVLESTLTNQEQAVIVARFGLDEKDPKTIQEVAELLGISRDRVRLMETKALNKLRNPQLNEKLMNYVATEPLEEATSPRFVAFGENRSKVHLEFRRQ